MTSDPKAPAWVKEVKGWGLGWLPIVKETPTYWYGQGAPDRKPYRIRKDNCRTRTQEEHELTLAEEAKDRERRQRQDALASKIRQLEAELAPLRREVETSIWSLRGKPPLPNEELDQLENRFKQCLTKALENG